MTARDTTEGYVKRPRGDRHDALPAQGICCFFTWLTVLWIGVAAADPKSIGSTTAAPPSAAVATAQSPILAPGYSALRFPTPEPGTYRLPPIAPAPDGEVLDTGGHPIRLHQLYEDRFVVLSFIYSTCDDVNGCPLATHVLYRLFRTLKVEPELARKVQLLTLSFDPSNDTPEVMRLYGQGFAKGPPDWTFLTAESDAALAPVLSAYGQSVNRILDAQGRDSGRIAHVLRVYLIDRARRIRNIYSVSFLHPDLVMADLRTLILEDQAPPADPAGSAYQTQARPSPRTAELLAQALHPPLGLPPLPPGPALTAERIDLGRKLFFDRRLSANGSLSCALCHIPTQGFSARAMSRAVGMEGRSLRRNASSLYNVAYADPLFPDGRERGLDTLTWQELLDPERMGNLSVAMALDKVQALPDYLGLFEAAFEGRSAGMETLGQAMAAYLRTLVTARSPFDRWRFGGDATAMDESAVRGLRLFDGKAGCRDCHRLAEDHALLTDNALYDTGIGWHRSMGAPTPRPVIEPVPGIRIEVDPAAVAGTEERPFNDLGRYEVTQDPADRWRFRTPSLRNVALTAPYMHDGSLPDLAAVVEHYNRGGHPHPGQDPRIRPLGLSQAEQADLVAFLHALTGDNLDLIAVDAEAAEGG